MLIEDRFWCSLDDLSLQPKLRYFDKTVGFNPIIKQMKIEAFYDTNPKMFVTVLILSGHSVYPRLVLNFNFSQQNQQIYFIVQTQVLYILVDFILVQLTKFVSL